MLTTVPLWHVKRSCCLHFTFVQRAEGFSALPHILKWIAPRSPRPNTSMSVFL
jgi:hypothetical protein